MTTTQRRGPLEGLRAKYDVVAREAAKFGMVGAVNTVLDFAVLNLLVFGLGLQPLRSKVISTVIATTSSYLMNRHWTFRHRDRQAVRREYAIFFGLNAVGLGIALLVLGVVRYGLGLDGALAINIANIIGTGLGTLFRFWSYRRWVWTKSDAVVTAADEGDVVAAVVVDTADTADTADVPDTPDVPGAPDVHGAPGTDPLRRAS